jgi:hypothetical protein
MSTSPFKKPAVSRKEMEALTHDVEHTRRRYDLYKAKNSASGEASPERLKVLKSESEIAQMKLIRAKNA